jgi:hypothetical protein
MRDDIVGQNISHICGNSLCLTKDHLMLEPQCFNNQRTACKSDSGIKTSEGKEVHVGLQTQLL